MKKEYIFLIFVIAAVFVAAGVYMFLDLYSAPSNLTKIQPKASEIIRDNSAMMDENLAAVQPVDLPIPVFALTDLTGRKIVVEPQASGKTVYHFWASWCAPCILELPELLERAHKEKARFFIISVDEDIQAILRFQARLMRAGPNTSFEGENITWLHDPQKKVMEGMFGIRKLPETYIADDTAKRLKGHIAGATDWGNADLFPED